MSGLPQDRDSGGVERLAVVERPRGCCGLPQWRLTAGLIIMTSVLACVWSAQGQASGGEASGAQRAAWLFAIAKFTTWPKTESLKASGRLTVGILGEDPFGAGGRDTLKKLNRQSETRNLELLSVKEEDDVASCQILFVFDNDQRAVQTALEWAQGKPIVTVGRHADFANKLGGLIRWVEVAPRNKKKKLECEFNTDAASDLDIKFDHRLLTSLQRK